MDQPSPQQKSQAETGVQGQPDPSGHPAGHEPVALMDAPAERVGLLLAEARTRQGLRLDEVADHLEGSIDATRLMALESGAIRVSPEVFAELGRVYGIEPRDLVPPRDQLIVDLNEGYLRAGPDIALLNDGVGRREVLSGYLDMLWELREIQPGTKIPLRDADLEVLATQLGVEAGQVESDLRRLMAAESARPGRRSRVLVGLGAALALVTGGVLLWQGSNDTVPQGEPTAVTSESTSVTSVVTSVPESGLPDSGVPLPPAPTAEIGEAATLERDAPASEAPVPDAPAPDAPAPEAPVAVAPATESRATAGADADATLPPAPTAEIGDAAVQERNADGTPGAQTTR